MKTRYRQLHKIKNSKQYLRRWLKSISGKQYFFGGNKSGKTESLSNKFNRVYFKLNSNRKDYRGYLQSLTN